MATELEKIRAMATELLKQDAEIAELEESLQVVKRARAKLAESDLPEAMEEAGMLDFTLADGRVITLAYEVYAHISEANRGEAHQWLRNSGHDDIIKRVLTVKFGKGEDQKAVKVFEDLVGRPDLSDNEIVSKESVHASTLKAFVRNSLESGIDLPMELFGVHEKALVKVGSKRSKPQRRIK